MAEQVIRTLSRRERRAAKHLKKGGIQWELLISPEDVLILVKILSVYGRNIRYMPLWNDRAVKQFDGSYKAMTDTELSSIMNRFGNFEQFLRTQHLFQNNLVPLAPQGLIGPATAEDLV